MLGISRRYAHFIFGVIQSGLSSTFASAIASYPFLAQRTFLAHWLLSWSLSWSLILPVVVCTSSNQCGRRGFEVKRVSGSSLVGFQAIAF